jgi:acetolactate synthase-1/2/3 large subunit
MKAGRILLEMLRQYGVKTVFGLPGETTLDLYREWKNFPHIEHVLVRDERNSVFMAEAYAKVSGRPGVCEGPSVGAPHMLPGVMEARDSCIPLIVITSDIPLYYGERNMLTGSDHKAIFGPFVKESLEVRRAQDIPFLVRRAFRLATTGRPGPVHMRFPMNIFQEDLEVPDLYAQEAFATYPGQRFQGAEEDIRQALKELRGKMRGVLFCGQGVHLSGAYQEVQTLAELLGYGVGTTIGGKGGIAETHPLSLGCIGARGGTSFSNEVVAEAEALLFLGCSTDSAGTDGWKKPLWNTEQFLLQIDASEGELGNNYPQAITLFGDLKATLQRMLEILREEPLQICKDESWAENIRQKREEYGVLCAGRREAFSSTVHPLKIVEALQETAPKDALYVADPGISAVYPAAFLKMAQAGRSFISNFSQGALGYATAASLGAWKAGGGRKVINLTGDGSLGFCTGELETIARNRADITVILFHNRSFGWIRGTDAYEGEKTFFATDFSETDYCTVARGFGFTTFCVKEGKNPREILQKAFALSGPVFVEIESLPEDRCFPPVPGWTDVAREKGMENCY